ncbi:helix-turn-helix domain-containing protein [Wocania ichthyoenteri]|uniref:helix-turn-helix domain-containing protein n=1 Tax=Wocania ichthyoenteri TaxID=1230531 RepID=UPI00053EA9A1|nr:AraC family transcriptional regulator [Wocania ichthyoenteri]
MLFRVIVFIYLFILSCASPDRNDIVFEDFEKGTFENWNTQGNSFQTPVHIDSIDKSFKNAHGKFIAFSNSVGVGESISQGKLVSEKFTIQRKYINFLISGGNHTVRECVNLIIDNKIVKTATGKNDFTFRRISWDVSEYEGKECVIEIVDAITPNFNKNTVEYICADYFVFSDNTHKREVVFEDFESGTYNNWIVKGDAFEVPRNRTNVYYPISANGFNGQYFAFSFGRKHDKKKGKLISNEFTINHDFIRLLVGGGNHKYKTCINLVVNDRIVHSATGENDGVLRTKTWDVKTYIGQQATIKIIDDYSESWGHIMVDDIVFYDEDKTFVYLLFIVGICLLFFIAYRFFKYRNRATIKNDINSEEQIRLDQIKLQIKTSEGYLNPDYSIKRFIKEFQYSEKEIDELFEKSENISFLNYINYLRVEAFKKQLKNPKNDAFTMISIAEQCGFKSKTSFYRIFKSVTNITPSEYKKQLK